MPEQQTDVLFRKMTVFSDLESCLSKSNSVDTKKPGTRGGFSVQSLHCHLKLQTIREKCWTDFQLVSWKDPHQTVENCARDTEKRFNCSRNRMRGRSGGSIGPAPRIRAKDDSPTKQGAEAAQIPLHLPIFLEGLFPCLMSGVS